MSYTLQSNVHDIIINYETSGRRKLRFPLDYLKKFYSQTFYS